MFESLDCPDVLRRGDRVRLVAPSGPIDAGQFEAGVAWLKEQELEPVYDDGILSQEGFLAGSDERRLAEFQAALNDPEARAIWAARGGYGSTRLLPHLDPEEVRRQAKWFIGFSDVTAIHGLWRRAGLASLHAANVTSLGRWQSEGLSMLRSALFDGGHATLTALDAMGQGAVTGPLAGGNLCLLGSLLGTPYFPNLDGTVLLIEDVNEVPYKIDRLLTQLTQGQALTNVLGLAVGHLSGCDDHPDKPGATTGEAVIRAHADALGIPALFGLNIGHGADSTSALLGMRVTLDPARKLLSY